MWESIGLLLLYLISGYLNKRKKDQKNREIESDPEWDTPKEEGFDDLLLNLFNQKETLDTVEEQSSENVQNIEESQPSNHEVINDKFLEKELNTNETRVISNLKKENEFKDEIYHSKLADRKELHLGNKWKTKKSIRMKLFGSPNSLKRAFVLKEILDDPVSLKKSN